MSGPSEKAIERATLRSRVGICPPRDVVAAAHDPALGLDRSICLRDVVEALRTTAGSVTTDYISRKFGGGA